MCADNVKLSVVGARENNLKNISVDIPRGLLTAVTGPSGSGKSSLVFDTIYKEARRIFLEPFSYLKSKTNRQAVKALFCARANVDSVSGLSVACAVDAKRLRIPKSATLASFTGSYEYLRQLFFHLGVGVCRSCGGDLITHSRREMLQTIEHQFKGEMVQLQGAIGAQVGKNLKTIFDSICSKGYSIVEVDGALLNLSNSVEVDEFFDDVEEAEIYDLSLVVDVLRIKDTLDVRLIDAVNLALAEGDGLRCIKVDGNESTDTSLCFSERLVCTRCSLQHDDFVIGEYSYYREGGCCLTCLGSGLGEGLSEPCSDCVGSRVRLAARTRKLAGASFSQVFTAAVSDAKLWVEKLSAELATGEFSIMERRDLSTTAKALLHQGVAELSLLLVALNDLGLSYLPLSRSLSTLSTGELQRARIARDLSRPLRGLLYVLDEPTTALHPEDAEAVVKALRSLIESGASVIAIEHDPLFIRASDYVVELGPESGQRGGELIFSGIQSEFKNSSSLTSKYVYGATSSLANDMSSEEGGDLIVTDISIRNLKIPQLKLPLNKLSVIAGVSGSGKSTLLFECILPGLEALPDSYPGLGELQGASNIRRVVDCSRVSEINNVRSTVATIIGVLDPLRTLFSKTIDAKIRGFSKSEFSYSTARGACGFCRGSGESEEFLDAFVPLRSTCPKCHGTRYKPAVAEVKYRGYSIVDVLSMSVEQVREEFLSVPGIYRRLDLLCEMGLSYLSLNFPGRLLSLGELQRLQLASDILKVKDQRGVLYAFDEPTRGLGGVEVEYLIEIYKNLLSKGCTVVVIEHNLDVIRAAQHIIELGPGGGCKGGELLYSGSLQDLTGCPKSKIAAYTNRK